MINEELCQWHVRHIARNVVHCTPLPTLGDTVMVLMGNSSKCKFNPYFNIFIPPSFVPDDQIPLNSIDITLVGFLCMMTILLLSSSFSLQITSSLFFNWFCWKARSFSSPTTRHWLKTLLIRSNDCSFLGNMPVLLSLFCLPLCSLPFKFREAILLELKRWAQWESLKQVIMNRSGFLNANYQPMSYWWTWILTGYWWQRH